MSESKHTPGPCSVLDVGGGMFELAVNGQHMSTTNDEKHAKLRAAEFNTFWRKAGGPDLLAAVQECNHQAWWSELHKPADDELRHRLGTVLMQTRAAIAKATT
jgi:hypothetical protein